MKKSLLDRMCEAADRYKAAGDPKDLADASRWGQAIAMQTHTYYKIPKRTRKPRKLVK